jgi:hypothetical protein
MGIGITRVKGKGSLECRYRLGKSLAAIKPPSLS